MCDSLTQRSFVHQVLRPNSFSAFLRYKKKFYLQSGCDAGKLDFRHYDFGKTVGISCISHFSDGPDLYDPEALTWSAKWKVTDGKVSLLNVFYLLMIFQYLKFIFVKC